MTLVVILILVACQPQFGRRFPQVNSGTFTSATGASFTYAGQNHALLIKAVAPNDGNVREAFWYPDSPWSTDQKYCATWYNLAQQNAEELQQGIALRIAQSGPNPHMVKAITITQSVWADANWLFNVHRMDGSNAAAPFSQLVQWNYAGVVSHPGAGAVHYAPGPWHACAIVQGRTLWFKLWTAEQAGEPSWSDPKFVRSMTLPADLVYSGYPGGYIGHLRQGRGAYVSGITYGQIQQ